MRRLSAVQIGAFLALMLFSISWSPWGWNWTDLQRWCFLISTSISLMTLLSEGGDAFSVPARLRWQVCVLVSGALTSVLLSDVPFWSLLEFGVWMSLWLNAFAVRTSLSQGAMRSRWLLVCLVLAVAVFVVVRFGVFLLALSENPLVAMDALYGGFSNVRSLGHFQTLTIPVLAGGFFLFGGAKRFFCLALLIAWCWVAVYTHTRGTFLAALVVICACLFTRGRIGKRLAALIATAFCLAWIANALMLAVPDSALALAAEASNLRHPAGAASLAGREVLWGQAWTLFERNPWFGTGPMGFANLHSPLGAHPHNIVLQLLAEWGGVPTFCLAVLAGVFGHRLWRLVRQCSLEIHEVVAIMSLLGLLAQSLVDGVFVLPFSQFCLALSAGWVWFVLARHDTSAQTGESAVLRKLICFGVTACVVYVFLFSLADFSFSYPDRAFQSVQWPRYWAVGFI
ncbi:MAG: O-antigen ligase family protein [Candidatus Dactylopiibacterium sp.]|nr:O-antigen ligase family protein [Candidatus Dactylopiibacterium sp.]